MHKIRYRIAALAGGAVLVTLLLIMAAFNVIIRHEMHDNADLSLRMILGKVSQRLPHFHSIHRN